MNNRHSFQDLTGLQLGVWKVIAYNRSAGQTPRWQCQCVHCGHEREVLGAHLRNNPPNCKECGWVDKITGMDQIEKGRKIAPFRRSSWPPFPPPSKRSSWPS